MVQSSAHETHHSLGSSVNLPPFLGARGREKATYVQLRVNIAVDRESLLVQVTSSRQDFRFWMLNCLLRSSTAGWSRGKAIARCG